MKIPDDCIKCVAECICPTIVIRGDSACQNFHKALESKVQIELLKIGDFEISQFHTSEDKVWIIHKSGESSEFDKVHFGKAVEKYYEENF